MTIIDERVYKILICDLVGLKSSPDGTPDCSEVRAYIEAKGGVFHAGSPGSAASLEAGKLHFFYRPDLAARDELLECAGAGQYDAVIAAATFLPPETVFPMGGVRIGAGTGNMGSRSWGGGDGEGGSAPLMNTPGINSRATAQMVMKALLKVLPDLPVEEMHRLVCARSFDTGRDLRAYPTSKLEGKRMAVLGYGNIGREVARLSAAFGLEVVVYARKPHRAFIESEGFVYAASPLEAARGADVLSVHLGLGPQDRATGKHANAGLVDDAILSVLTDGAVLINYDRGELVDVGALERALASGRVRYAAIDADLFRDPQTGASSGPMAPYLALTERFTERLELLPHAAADTDHPSRVAGAKQAVDQIFEAILHKRVVNRKGSLPDGYQDGGKRKPAGLGAVTSSQLLSVAEKGTAAKSLAEDAATLAAFWSRLDAAHSDDRAALVADHAETATLAANRLLSRLTKEGLLGPFSP